MPSGLSISSARWATRPALRAIRAKPRTMRGGKPRSASAAPPTPAPLIGSARPDARGVRRRPAAARAGAGRARPCSLGDLVHPRRARVDLLVHRMAEPGDPPALRQPRLDGSPRRRGQRRRRVGPGLGDHRLEERGRVLDHARGTPCPRPADPPPPRPAATPARPCRSAARPAPSASGRGRRATPAPRRAARVSPGVGSRPWTSRNASSVNVTLPISSPARSRPRMMIASGVRRADAGAAPSRSPAGRPRRVEVDLVVVALAAQLVLGDPARSACAAARRPPRCSAAP